MQTVKNCCSMWMCYQISLWPYHQTYVGRGVLDPIRSAMLLQSRARIIQDLGRSHIWAIAPRPPVQVVTKSFLLMPLRDARHLSR
jgi:hypothetical protein